ncbi:MAG: hypothetical protein ACI9ON_001228 [Limisphaerales bacterium]|jgi:hypothetical protein
MERLEELTNSQRQILARMGVQLYYSRRSGGENAVAGLEVAGLEVAGLEVAHAEPSPAVAPSTTTGPVPTPAPTPESGLASTKETPTFAEIQFVWIRGSAGILLVEQLHDDFKPFVRDLIGFLDWRAGAEPTSMRNGRFRWPKLDGGGGSPAGSLRAFKEKYVGSSNQWLVTTPELAARLETFLLVDHEGALHKIDELSGALTAEAKRKMWFTLTS